MLNTCLFKGDRVRVSQSYINGRDIMFTLKNQHVSNALALNHQNAVRVGTIMTNPQDPDAEEIGVLWDGNKHVGKHDVYMPCDLVLVEEDDTPEITSGGVRREKLIKMFTGRWDDDKRTPSNPAKSGGYYGRSSKTRGGAYFNGIGVPYKADQ